jgi:hypothetical protein
MAMERPIPLDAPTTSTVWVFRETGIYGSVSQRIWMPRPTDYSIVKELRKIYRGLFSQFFTSTDTKIRLICAATAKQRSCTARHPTHAGPLGGSDMFAPPGRSGSPLAEHLNSLAINYSRFSRGDSHESAM